MRSVGVGRKASFGDATAFGVDRAARDLTPRLILRLHAPTRPYLDQAPGSTAPRPMHLAEEDEFITKDAQARIKAAVAGVPSVTVYLYQARTTHSRATPGCTTMPRRQRSQNGRTLPSSRTISA
jgi:dienelactone hydrolase